ncbi:MAG: response regulator transcription factor [Roseivivax sp.]|nr:response regulator transcription factor [Roseivivax sp.]
MKRVILADDHPIFLEGLSTLLTGAGFEVVARCTTGTEVFEALGKALPDFLLLDVNMPPPNGMDVVRRLKEDHVPVKIVFLTSSLDEMQTFEAIDLGVDGLVLKESAPRQLLQCLGSVAAGDRWYDPQIAKRALDLAMLRRQPPSQIAQTLTNRELQVARLVAAGLRNREIGSELNIGEGTVKMYLHSIYEKSGVNSRVELANLARAKRWLQS